MTTTMRTALVKTDANCHKVVRYDDYKSQKEFAADLRGNGYKVLKIWNGNVSDAEVEEWHFLNRDYDKRDTEKRFDAIISNADLTACIDDYAVDVDTAAEVEEINSESAVEVKKFEVGKIYTSNGNHFKVVKREAGNFITMIDTSTGEKIRRKSLIANDKETFYPTVGGEAIQATDGIFDTLKAKVAEIKNRKHKSCIDWDAAYKEIRLAEIFSLQKEFKKLLKLGELERAENVFENIKMIFKAA